MTSRRARSTLGRVGRVDEDDDQPENLNSKAARLARLPNVHAGLHLGEVPWRFGTLVNVCASAGEERHKSSKRQAQHNTSYAHDTIPQLLQRVNIDSAIENHLRRVARAGSTAVDDRSQFFDGFLMRNQALLPRLMTSTADQGDPVPGRNLVVRRHLTDQERARRALPNPRLGDMSNHTARDIMSAYRDVGRSLYDVRGTLKYGLSLSGDAGPIIQVGEFLRIGEKIVQVLAVAQHVPGSFFVYAQGLQRGGFTPRRDSSLRQVFDLPFLKDAAWTINRDDKNWYHLDRIWRDGDVTADGDFSWLHAIPAPRAHQDIPALFTLRDRTLSEHDVVRPELQDATYFFNSWSGVAVH